MARPGGNPDLAKYHFEQKYDWEEPCTELISLRVPASMKAAIKAGEVKDWQEIARKAIAAAISDSKKETATTSF